MTLKIVQCETFKAPKHCSVARVVEFWDYWYYSEIIEFCNMLDDLISIEMDLCSDLATQILNVCSKMDHFLIVSPASYTQYGSIRFQKIDGVNIQKISAPKRSAVKPFPNNTKQMLKQPKPNPKPAPNNLNTDYAVLSAASSKVDTSTLISVVQNLRTNEKEYRCSFCEYMSKEQRNVKRHVELKHIDTGSVFQCKTCGHTSKLKANLKRHYITCHNIPPEEAAAMLTL